MKLSVVPAQITTIEDRIAGNLSLSQVMLLVLPIFIGTALYVALPPFYHAAVYKIALICTLSLCAGLLSIRVRGQIVLLWLITLGRYNRRPRFYVYNVNDTAGRAIWHNTSLPLEDTPLDEAAILGAPELQRLSIAEQSLVRSYLDDPAAHLSFRTNKRGGLRVLITEVKD